MENKKGTVDSKMTFLIGALILVVLATALAPVMFDNIDLFNTTSEGGNDTTACSESADFECGNIPVWVPTVLVVIVGAGIVFLIWRSFGVSTKYKRYP